jgi:hypothetical protein
LTFLGIGREREFQDDAGHPIVLWSTASFK